MFNSASIPSFASRRPHHLGHSAAPALLCSLLLGLVCCATAAPAQTQSVAEGLPATGAPAAAPTTAPPTATSPAAAEPAPSSALTTAADEALAGTGATEEQLRQRLIGKSFYLRQGWLSDALSFDQQGHLDGHAPQGSYTLAIVQIQRLHLTKRKLILEGARFGLHFLGQLASEQSDGAYDRVRITPPKKSVRIFIDRMTVVKPKKVKEKNKRQNQQDNPSGDQPQTAAGMDNAAGAPASQAAKADTDSDDETGKTSPDSADETDTAESDPAGQTEPAAASPSPTPAAEAATPGQAAPDQATAAAADAKNSTTTSPAYAARVLDQALDTIFAPNLDERLMASLPEFWQLYYAAAQARAEYRPRDPAVQRQNTVDRKARLLGSVEPPSNEYAQAAGVAGMTLYHVVIGPDGKPGEIAVARPIGFGLDENAVEAIRKARFEPALKAGQPVPVLLDLFVQFRIYSKRTSTPATPASKDKPSDPVLPGPYTVERH